MPQSRGPAGVPRSPSTAASVPIGAAGTGRRRLAAPARIAPFHGMRTVLRSAHVRVPGSTSNLGAGFDCIGLAVRRYLDVRFEPGGRELSVERLGALRRLGRPGADLLVDAFTRELERLGASRPHGRLVAESEIPIGRGLGSSAAAIVAGLALAAAASGTRLERRAAVERAAELEGHPDNAAPALMGGLVAVVYREDGSIRPLRLGLSEHLGFAYAAPGTTISTAAARSALPQEVPHGVAVRASSRMVALLRGLATGDPDLLRIGFADELHVPHRLPLIPCAESAMAAAREAGAFAATVSGSGSGLIAVGRPERAEEVAAAMAGAFAKAAGEDDVVAFAAPPDFQGAAVVDD